MIVVEVLVCSFLKYDLWKLNLVLNSFSVCSIYVSWLFEIVSVTASRSDKEEMSKISKHKSWQITIEANKIVVDFLNITMI